MTKSEIIALFHDTLEKFNEHLNDNQIDDLKDKLPVAIEKTAQLLKQASDDRDKARQKKEDDARVISEQRRSDRAIERMKRVRKKQLYDVIDSALIHLRHESVRRYRMSLRHYIMKTLELLDKIETAEMIDESTFDARTLAAIKRDNTLIEKEMTRNVGTYKKES